MTTNSEGHMEGNDAQALDGAAAFFEQIATMGDPAPLAFAQAIRRSMASHGRMLEALRVTLVALEANGFNPEGHTFKTVRAAIYLATGASDARG